MAKPKPFDHVDGNLTEHLRETVLSPDRPFLERVVAGMTLVAARGLLDQVNKQNEQLPDAPAALPPVEGESR